jgi:predicted enzyme related to lactoylglutathione lyase
VGLLALGALDAARAAGAAPQLRRPASWAAPLFSGALRRARRRSLAATVNDIGAWCWNELMTTDVEQAKAFFGELLGWTYETDDSGYTIKNAGHLNGGMRRQSEEQGEVEPPGFPTFTVESSDEATSDAERLGQGRVSSGAGRDRHQVL